MQVEKIDTGRFLIIFSEDEDAILRILCRKCEFHQDVLVSRLLGNALRFMYHIFFPSQWAGG